MAKSNSNSSKPVQVEVNKSAVTGKFVSDNYTKSHPKTTYTQTVTKGDKKK